MNIDIKCPNNSNASAQKVEKEKGRKSQNDSVGLATGNEDSLSHHHHHQQHWNNKKDWFSLILEACCTNLCRGGVRQACADGAR